MPNAMRWMWQSLRRGLLGFLALLPFAGVAAAEPALWVMRDGNATIYLFGTIHLLKSGTEWRSEKIAAALRQSDALWLELAEGSGVSEAALWKYGKDPAHPLSTKLDPAELQKLRAAAERAGIAPVTLESLRPWLAAVTLGATPLKRAGYESGLGVDNQLLAEAKAEGKQVQGLETPEQQLQFFADLPQEMELALLNQIVAAQDQAPDQLDRIAGAWLAGDVDGLGRLLQGEELSAEDGAFYRRLLTDRNANWAEQIAALTRQGGTHFVAVGAAHLAGRNSLQQMLEDRGFKVARF
jgi:uncharacterized protein YbaP (TraB family)